MPEDHLKRAATLAHLLDTQFGFGKYRFGLSALIDLIPVAGDFVDAALSLYIISIAVQMKVPAWIYVRMVINIAINFLFGLLPIVGDLVYFIRKVNVKNVRLLENYVAKKTH